MRKIKSKCCNADVEDNWYPGKTYKDATEIKHRCLKCGKLCKLEEEKNKDKRNVVHISDRIDK